MAKRFNSSIASGTADSVAAGSAVNGNSLFLGGDAQKVKNLSAVVAVDIETNTITLTAKWQVSNDASTWYDLANGPQNAAGVVLGTGTGGADAAITKVIPAPDCIYGYRFARLALVVGVTTGTTSDTYSIGYSYDQN
jgi:hypothetical protein